MTGPFTATLRTRERGEGGELRLGTPGEPLVTFRVQIPEIWDTIRIEAPPDTPVSVIKERALATLLPDESSAQEFVMKIEGWEVLDERVSVSGAGARDGSIFLLTGRRRRPVR
ncbi:MAG: hypothetical protein ACT4OZ_11880 [Gemmatimonadota bacterium]